MAPIYKSLGHLIDMVKWGQEGGHTTDGGSQMDGWGLECPKRKINTHYPPDSVSLATDHVNGVRKSRENEVMDRWQDMMIKSLVDINTSIYTPTKC